MRPTKEDPNPYQKDLACAQGNRCIRGGPRDDFSSGHCKITFPVGFVHDSFLPPAVRTPVESSHPMPMSVFSEVDRTVPQNLIPVRADTCFGFAVCAESDKELTAQLNGRTFV
jgi:hypothetical protein